MKCDLHVHSFHSGRFPVPVLRHLARESYSDPVEVYRELKRRGMTLVTLTDHDSIDGAEALLSFPDFFVSEEVTCRLPSGTEAHIGVYDINEHQHVEIQHRRNDVISLLMYLTENRIFFSINHAFSSLTGRRELEDFNWFEDYFPAMETRNAQIPPANNRLARRLARQHNKIAIGGSDSHTLHSVATAWTEVPGARTKDDFLEGLRQRRGLVRGEHGNYGKLTSDVCRVALEMMCAERSKFLLAPLLVLIPIVTLTNVLGEAWFARAWSRKVMPEWRVRDRSPLWVLENAATEECV